MIFLVSCGTSCKGDFDWKPDPYRGDSVDQTLTNAEGVVVSCSQPTFDEFTCFDAQNIADLKTAIDKVEGIKKKDKKRILKGIDTIFSNPKLKSLSRGVSLPL